MARVLAGYLRGRGYSVLEQPVGRRSHQRDRRGRASRRWCSRRTSTACRRSSRAASRAACCTAAARATPRASWPRRWRRPSGCARRARRASAWCSWSARSAAATAPRRPTPSPRSRAFLINGEPTELKLGLATRGCFRVRLTAHGRAAHSGYPELGESAIEKLLDVLHDAARRRRGRPIRCSAARTTPSGSSTAASRPT